MRGKKEPGRRGAKPGKAKVNIDPAGRRLSPTSAARDRQLEQRLAEALEQQAATSEILRVVSSSPHDVQPVFDAIVRSSVRLCGGLISCVFRYDGERLHFVGHHNFPPAALDIYQRTYPLTLDRDRLLGRAILERRPVNVADVFAEFRSHIGQRELGNRSILAVPMLHEGAAIGVIAVSRAVPGLFPEHQVALVQTFADQAVIAIENVRLFRELAARNGELTEALSQQTATGEVLRVISSSPTDAQPVFETIVRNAARLCDAEFSAVSRYEGGLLHMGSINNMTPEEMEVFHRLFPRPAERGFVMGRAFVDGRTVHIEDVLEDPEYDRRTQGPLLRVARFRTFLGVPILRDGKPIGVIGCARREVRPFTATQIELVKTFAEQAVIAIENVRLFKELEARNRDLTEALDQQTATGEILRVISQSQTDVQPVFDAIVRSAARLCDGLFSALFRYDGEFIHQVAQHNFSPEALEEVRRVYPARPRRAHGSARAILERAVVHIPDVARDADYLHQELTRAVGFRSGLFVPMLRDGESIGVIMVARAEPGPFSDSEIELLKTFADQAVIAVENVRLFTELEVRNRDLTETLEQKTATSEILRVISSSPTDVQPVFDTIASNARRLCNADSGSVFTYDGTLVHLVSLDNTSPERSEALRRVYPLVPTPETVGGRAILTRQPVHISDVRDDPTYVLPSLQDAGLRSVLSVPMLRDGLPVGIIIVHTWETPRPFTRTQIDLLKTFADQAVIAIENVRLFRELDARNRDLTETLEQQTATSELLKVIGRSTFDLQPVFETLAENAVRLCKAERAFIWRPDGEVLRAVVIHNASPELRDFAQANPIAPGHNSGAARAALERRTVHIPDALADPEYTFGVREVDPIRTVLAIPMLRANELLGVIAIYRLEVNPFTDSQIALLETFADQAAIAIENARLLNELQAKNADLTETLEQQTATSEILRVISSSPTDVQPVFNAIARSAKRLCQGEFAWVFKFDGQLLHVVAHDGLSPAAVNVLRQAFPRAADRGTAAGCSVLDGAVTQIPDVHAHSDFALGGVATDMNFRSVVAVPMLREGLPIGAIAVARSQSGLFSARLTDLLKTFADQAVIAVENVRLFQELEASTQDLTRSVGELRALGEVGQAVSSTLDLETVLATIVSHAVQLSGSHGGVVYEFDEDTQSFHARATHQITPEHLEALRAAPIRLGEGAVGRAGVVREPVQIADIQDERELVAPQAREHLIRQGMRALLAMPLVRDDRLLGGIVITRREVGAFSPGVVATLQTFAAQSVLAFQNARLFRESQRQKQYSEMLVETSPVAIATMDLRGAVVGWNPGAERLFGFPPAEALGHQMEDLVGTPELREEVRANIRQTLAGEWIRAITRRARKNGTLVDVEISSMPVIVDGAKVGMIAIYHDITELLQARREAEAANEAKSAFLATMSHEIRTPMNAVIGMSGLLLNTALTDEQREYAEIVRQSGDTLLTVINDILDFSKIEAGRLELESQPFDVRECIESALDLVATRAAEKGIDLAYLIGDGTPAAVVGDVTRLRQVLLNLLSNAVKFTEAGEVVLSVSARRRDGGAPLHDLTFSVRDTGIGIPPDRLDRLFQSFSQVDASTTRRYGGTGLGLAISQRLTELMGGRISVTSQVGAGSEFHFTIRVPATESPLPARRDLSGVQPSLRGKRVLVVDDNATNRRILTAHLDAWGMRARATESPIEALNWVRGGERFDVGILDMHMPEMDGVALAGAIREHPAGTPLSLVLFTSLGRREARAEEAGFAAYLNKPIKPSQLFDALVSVLAEQTVHVPSRRAVRSELDPEMAARHPLRILLAEDNVVNQKVALRILGQMGYRADVAANGLEAIEAVERQTYDVVLMDVQMPELDGFEASREINRRWPGERRPRLVAMTANAMEGDRELCMAAGMDDYVAKPIRVEELVAALARGRPRGKAGPGASSDGGGAGAPAAAGAIDRGAFDRLTATMDAAFVAELIDTYVDDARGLIATLRRSLAAADRDAFRRAAHSLKSTSESLGATDLTNLARELETIGRSGVLSDVGDRIEHLAAQYELVTLALGALRHGLTR